MYNSLNRLCIIGSVDGVGFEEFLDLYLQRLDLKLVAVIPHPDHLEVFVRGAPELVEMLHMACWLGPERAAVTDVRLTYL